MRLPFFPTTARLFGFFNYETKIETQKRLLCKKKKKKKQTGRCLRTTQKMRWQDLWKLTKNFMIPLFLYRPFTTPYVHIHVASSVLVNINFYLEDSILYMHVNAPVQVKWVSVYEIYSHLLNSYSLCSIQCPFAGKCVQVPQLSYRVWWCQCIASWSMDWYAVNWRVVTSHPAHQLMGFWKSI